MPPKKEIHYFDRSCNYPSSNLLALETIWQKLLNKRWRVGAIRDISNSIPDYDKVLWYYNYYFSEYNDDWYVSLFDNSDKVCGEVSPSYSILESSDIRLISQINLNLKILLMVRNPIERSWSQYKFDRQKGFHSPSLKDRDGLRKYFMATSQFSRSNCLSTISKFQQHFWGDKFLVGFFDAVTKSPNALIRDILYFLSMENTVVHLPQGQNKINSSIDLEMPDYVRSFLIELYHPIISELSESYGGYFSKWLSDLEGTPQMVKESDLKATFLVRRKS